MRVCVRMSLRGRGRYREMKNKNESESVCENVFEREGQIQRDDE